MASTPIGSGSSAAAGNGTTGNETTGTATTAERGASLFAGLTFSSDAITVQPAEIATVYSMQDTLVLGNMQACFVANGVAGCASASELDGEDFRAAVCA